MNKSPAFLRDNCDRQSAAFPMTHHMVSLGLDLLEPWRHIYNDIVKIGVENQI